MTTPKKFLFVFAILFLASCTPPSPSLSISPNGSVLVPGETVTLTASLRNSDLKSEIAWASTGGTLSGPTGESVTFRAEQEGSYQVTATAIADPTFTRTVKITVGQEVSFGAPENPRVTEALLASGTSKTYIIKNTNGLSKNALYFEVVSSSSLRLTLYNQNGERLATSDNPLYFSRDGSSGNALETQAIENSSIPIDGWNEVCKHFPFDWMQREIATHANNLEEVALDVGMPLRFKLHTGRIVGTRVLERKEIEKIKPSKSHKKPLVGLIARKSVH